MLLDTTPPQSRRAYHAAQRVLIIAQPPGVDDGVRYYTGDFGDDDDATTLIDSAHMPCAPPPLQPRRELSYFAFLEEMLTSAISRRPKR